MADQKTRADSLWAYLTGATSDGGSQSDPDASLGNYRSSSTVQWFTWNRSSPIANIDIDFIARPNGTGNGSLTAPTADTLRWTPPGGTQGPAVTIANGETKILEGGGSDGPNKFIRVSRTSATGLTGTETTTISYKANNVVGFDDVSNTERTATGGDTEYRCLCLKNVSSAQVKSLKVKLNTLGTQRTTDAGQLGPTGAGTVETTGSFADWPSSGQAVIKDSGGTIRERVGYTSRTATVLTVPAEGRGLGVTSAAQGQATDTVDAVSCLELGKEAPASQPSGNFTTAADEDTAPGGISFSNPITDAEALDCGNLDAGYIYGIWLKRIVFEDTTAIADVLNDLIWKFDAA